MRVVHNYVHCLRTTEYDNLIKISERPLRIVFGYPSSSHSAPILARFSLMPISVRFSLKLYSVVFRCVLGQTSALLQDLFVLRSSAANTLQCRTRRHSSNGLVLPRVYSRYGLFSLSYLAADRWNSAPSDIRTAASPSLFRHALLSFLGYPVRRP